MLGLTTLGMIHTVIALVAWVCGFAALARDKEISSTNLLGRFYLVTTLVAAVTAFGLSKYGGFGPPRVLAVLTLVALAIGTLATISGMFSGASHSVRAVSYSATLLFHTIAGISESLTRLPPGAPLVSSLEAPVLKVVDLALLIVFAIVARRQVRRLRGDR